MATAADIPAGKAEVTMFVLAGIFIGAAFGAITARKRGGDRADMAQYGAGYGIALGLVGLIVTVIIHRAAV